MQGLRQAQELFDRRLPSDRRERAEREFEHSDETRAGETVIRSTKFVDLAEIDAYVERQRQAKVQHNEEQPTKGTK